MSDTPETDEQINGKPCTSFYVCAGDTLRDALVPSEFARKLERERDEAREVASGLAKQADRLRKERDEAREELAEAKRESENLARSIYRTEYSDNDTGWELLESVAGVISQIDNMYAGVREQRDEARKDLKITQEAWVKAKAERVEALRERNEAREALNEAHKYLKWIHDVADSQRRWNFRTLAKEGLLKTGDR